MSLFSDDFPGRGPAVESAPVINMSSSDLVVLVGLAGLLWELPTLVSGSARHQLLSPRLSYGPRAISNPSLDVMPDWNSARHEVRPAIEDPGGTSDEELVAVQGAKSAARTTDVPEPVSPSIGVCAKQSVSIPCPCCRAPSGLSRHRNLMHWPR
jgi:hypothetical protein